MSSGGGRRLFCRCCGRQFAPETLRERLTGTCSDERCYLPFSEASADKIQHDYKDYTAFRFTCLGCGVTIATGDKSERLCPRCRRRNRRYSSIP
ncbi:MAG: hypothetical protein A2284_18000 [Deltaproteobacteria bacterium RIFOXYA12_FULL_61_11]|nr:MAG: hypothetical protein A2284_18000 [Deltaproteobacteria bacterium RIFOXYA12_FULL_61_11]